MNKLLLGVLLVLGMVSCRKEKLGFIEEQNVENEKAALFVQLRPIAKRYVVDPTLKSILATQNNIFIKIPALAFVDKDGNVIENTVSLDILELKRISDIIRCQSSTSFDGMLINPVVQLEVKGKSGEKEVFLGEGNILKILIGREAPLSYTDLYLGTYSVDKGIAWEKDADKDHLVLNSWDTSKGVVKGFEMAINHLGWVSLQTKVSNLETTSLSIELPKEYTSDNTAVYSVIKSSHSVIPLYDNPDQHGFYSSLIPRNEDVSIFIISKQGNNDYAFLKWETNISKAASLQLEPKMVAFSEILEMLERE